MDEQIKSSVEVRVGQGIDEAFKHAARHGCAEISLKIPVPKTIIEDRGTVIERLRTRGTPIELMDSYAIAEEWDKAGQAFHCTMLELLYERLKEEFDAEVQFTAITSLHRVEAKAGTGHEEPLEIVIETGTEIHPKIAFGFDSQHDNIVSKKDMPRIHCPISKIDAGRSVAATADTAISWLSTLDYVVQSMIDVISGRIKQTDQSVPGKCRFYIVPALSNVIIGKTNVDAYVAIAGWRG